MANYHLETSVISRGKGSSIACSVGYISGRTLRDSYEDGKMYYHHRKDVVWQKIFLPDSAPPEFQDLQHLCDEINKAEKRWDARTARLFIGSLPNEVPRQEWVRIVQEFVMDCFVSSGLCVIAAIHEGRNTDDPSKNNPHAHLIVTTRTVGPEGFCRTKDREQNKKEHLLLWRKWWADVQNRAYERNRLNIRVSHESLEVQGVRDRKPMICISRVDYQREQRGEQTPAGDKKRAIQAWNEERARQRQLEQDREIELSR